MSTNAADPSKNLDPREVLKTLNEMGVRDVTAQQLKLFITDLKRLIRYDRLESGENVAPPNSNTNSVGERLYTRTTFSYRSRYVRSPVDPKAKPAFIHSKKKPIKVKPEPGNKECPCSNDRLPTSTDHQHQKSKAPKSFIRVPVEEKRQKCDPVSLYHYYESMWQKYKTRLPGESDRSELRWSVRTKLLGQRPSSAKSVSSQLSEEELERRRNGWMD